MQPSEISKEAIKSRIIRNASILWGYGETQDADSFDPVAGMLLGAVAEEIHVLSGEIRKADARIIEKMLELIMSPEMYSNMPAHAIACAKPLQPQISVTENFQFTCAGKESERINEESVAGKPICFTPTSEFRLFRGEVLFFGSGDTFFEFRERDKKIPVSSVIDRAEADFSKLYIGLKLDVNIDKLDGLSLMFSSKNRHNAELLYSMLPGSGWKINNAGIELRQGLNGMHRNGKLEEIFSKRNDFTISACNFINTLYGSRFMVIQKGDYRSGDFIRQNYVPPQLKKLVSEALKRIPDLFWIEVQLPQPLHPGMVNEISVSLNCFPVISRQMIEFSQILTQGLNVIPLKTQDQVFDVMSVTDTKGTVYKPVDSFRNGNTDGNSYILRQGGIARFDSRDAGETLSHLIDLVRDERAGFSLLGADLISSELKQLDQIITRLKQRLDTNETSYEPCSYLLLNSSSGLERATVRFWSTNGELSNNIKPGTKLTLNQGTEIDQNSIYLVTGSSGGRPRLSTEEKINKLRRMLLSKGRIVTMEDIKAVCFDHFGNSLEDVVIKKGIYLDPSPDRGFIRSIDIHLKLNEHSQLSVLAVEQKTDELKVKLMQESINLLPFRIFVS